MKNILNQEMKINNSQQDLHKKPPFDSMSLLSKENQKYVNGGTKRFSISQGGTRQRKTATNPLDLIKKLKANPDDGKSERSTSRMLKFVYSCKGGF